MNRDVVFIKRLVGLPGDRLQAMDGKLYVNGVAAGRALRATRRTASPIRRTPWARSPAPPTSQPWGLSDEYTVPEGHYFMMGDNRANSDDSRVWGPVPEDDLIGEAFFVYWPLDRLGTL